MLANDHSTQEKELSQNQAITTDIEKYNSIDELIKRADPLSDADKVNLLLTLDNNPILAQIPFKFIIELEEKEFNRIIQIYCTSKYDTNSTKKLLQLQQAKAAFDKIKSVSITQNEVGSIAGESLKTALLHNLSQDNDGGELAYPVGTDLSRSLQGNDGQKPLACVQQLAQKISTIPIQEPIFECPTEEQQIAELEKRIPLLATEIFKLLFDDAGAFHPAIKKLIDAITEFEPTQAAWLYAVILNVGGLFSTDRALVGLHCDDWTLSARMLSTLFSDTHDSENMGLLGKFFSESRDGTRSLAEFNEFFANNQELKKFYGNPNTKELIQLGS